LIGTFVETGASFSAIFVFCATAALSFGLVLRARYPEARAAFVLVLAGTAIILFDAFAEGPARLDSALHYVVRLHPGVIALLGLLFAVRPKPLLDTALAWALIASPVTSALLAPPNFWSTDLGTALYMPVALTAWTAILIYGLAATTGSAVARWGTA